MNKLKRREEPAEKRSGVKDRRSVLKSTSVKGDTLATLKKRITTFAKYTQPLGISFDQKRFETEEVETIGQVDRYSRFVDHILDLQKDELALVDWQIAKAAKRKKS